MDPSSRPTRRRFQFGVVELFVLTALLGVAWGLSASIPIGFSLSEPAEGTPDKSDGSPAKQGPFVIRPSPGTVTARGLVASVIVVLSWAALRNGAPDSLYIEFIESPPESKRSTRAQSRLFRAVTIQCRRVAQFRPRRFQFSMSMLLLLVALAASLIAWLVAVEQYTRPDRVEKLHLQIQDLEDERYHSSTVEAQEIDVRIEKLRKRHERLSAQ